MLRARSTLCVLLFAIVTSGMYAAAQGQDQPRFEDRMPVRKDRKRPSVLLRPKHKTAEEQLAYADQLRNDKKLRSAAKQYRALVHNWHDSDEATRAQLSYAEVLEERDKHLKAFGEYQYLIDYYGSGYDYDDVIDRQFRIAHHLMTARRGRVAGLKGFQSPERALPLFETVIENAPNGSRSDVAQFYIGVIREDSREYAEAVSAYETMFYRYPKSGFAPEAAQRRAACMVKISEKARNDAVVMQEAMSALAHYLRRFPEHEGVESAREQLTALKHRIEGKHYQVAQYYDRIASRPKAALISYRYFVQRFPYAELAATAESRIKELEATN